MIVTYWKGVFVADSLDERVILKKAGFELHEPTICHLRKEECKACKARIGRRWWTNRIESATRLKNYCNARALKVMKSHLEMLAKSRAVDSQISVPSPPGFEFYPYQKAGIAYALQRKDTLIGDDMGLGKAQPLGSKILTPNGWKLMGDIEVGDLIVGSSGKTIRVTGVFARGRRMTFRVRFSDGSKTDCCDDHLWSVNNPVRRYRDRPPKLLPLKSIRRNISDRWGNHQHFIPLVGPVDFLPGEKFDVHPYLLGALLGDGGLSSGAVCFTKGDTDLVRKLEKIKPRSVRLKRANKLTWRFVSKKRGSPNHLMNSLRRLNLMEKKSPDKFVPHRYLFAPVRDRLMLLHGLMDTDGWMSDGVVGFASSSRRLALDVVFLVRSLGGVARVSTKIPKYTYLGKKKTGRRSWVLTICMPDLFPPFSLRRKRRLWRPRAKYQPSRCIVSVDKIGKKETRCLSTDAPDGLYVTDDFVVTHNTPMALGFMNCVRPKNTIVVCPATLIFNWRNEAERWLCGEDDLGNLGYRIIEIQGKEDRVPDVVEQRDENFLVIVNYEKLVGDSPFAGSIAARTWDVAVFDEAHYLKNPESKRSQACIGQDGIMRSAHRCLFLTGTPIENYPKEIWPIASAISPAKFGDWFAFAARYCGAHQEERNGKKVWVTEGATHLAELQQRLRATCMVRRKKEDVLPELPPKRRQLIVLRDDKVDWSKDKRFARWQQGFDREYDEKVAKVESARTEAEFVEAASALEKVTGVPFEEISELRHELGKAKLPACLKFIDEVRRSSDDSLVIFAYHRDIVDALAKHLGAEAVVVHGGTPQRGPRSREEMVRLFQAKKKKIFIGQMRAAGVGLTLTAASTAIFVEEDWVPGAVTQCEDRLCRIGQKKMVHVIHAVLKDTIEVNMVQKVLAKMKVIDAALDKFPGLRRKQEAARTQVEIPLSEPNQVEARSAR